jgi:hypothetical protein
LQLILEGPFVVCENQDQQKNPGLTIWLPNLQFTHYLPAFTDGLEQPLVVLGNHKFLPDRKHYPRPEDDVELTMNFLQKRPAGAEQPEQMKLMPRTMNGTAVQDPGNSYLYSEKGDCSSVKKNQGSFQVAIPALPDEVWALNPTDAAIRIVDHGSAKHEGECAQWDKKHPNCSYATKLVLRYKFVDLSTFNISARCKGQTCHKMNLPWGPPGTAALIGSEFEVELSAPPIEIGSPETHAKKAFLSADRLSGLVPQRDLKWSDDPDDVKTSDAGAPQSADSHPKAGNLPADPAYEWKPWVVALRVACQAPATLICKKQPTDTAAAACPK